MKLNKNMISIPITQKIARYASLTPTGQRLSIGVTALLMQTTIDATNKNVDEKTRKHSAIRTAVKQVVSATSGIMFREIGQKLVGQKLVESGKLIVPQYYLDAYKKFTPQALNREYADLIGKTVSQLKDPATIEMVAKKAFAKNVGAVCAITGAIIGIFIMDVPFTNKILNVVMDKFVNKKKPEQPKQ